MIMLYLSWILLPILAPYKQEIALVGNGPLTPIQQAQLNSDHFNYVFRINHMPSLRYGDRVDGCFIRTRSSIFNPLQLKVPKIFLIGTERKFPIQKGQSMEILPSHRNLDFATDRQRSHNFFITFKGYDFPVTLENFVLGCSQRIVKEQNFGWTSGGIALLHLLRIAPYARIHLFGFNWNGIERYHKWETEALLAESLQKVGKIIIHPTDDKSKAYHHKL